MEDILEELLCPVCCEYCDDAMHCVNCNKVFCGKCVLVNNKPIPCPICRKNVTYTESKLARRMIANLPATCSNGCTDKFTRESIKQHLLKCPFRKYKCKLCKSEMAKDDFVNHLVANHSDILIEQYDEVQQAANNKPLTNSSQIINLNQSVVANKPLFLAPNNLVKYVSFTQNKPYEQKGSIIGTNNVNDLYDSSLTKGICCDKPGEILIEFDKEYKFNIIHVGGYNGDKYRWHFGMGNGSEIYTSKDKKNWVYVGNLVISDKNQTAEVKTNILSTTEAKYIRISNKSFLGLGYLAIPYI
jgi:hypothetical protein